MFLSAPEMMGIAVNPVWLALTSASFFVAAYFFVTNIRLRRKLTSSTGIVDSMVLRQDLLENDLQPHFLFNVMSAIQHLVISGEKYQAVRYFSVLGKYLRVSLEQNENDRVGQDQLLKALQYYVELEGLRFEKQIKLEFAISANIEALYVEYPYHLILNEIKKLINEQLRFSDQSEELLEISIERENGEIVILLKRKRLAGAESLSEHHEINSHIFEKVDGEKEVTIKPIMIRFAL